MPTGLHAHYYNGTTLVTDRHDHRYSGSTRKDPDTMGHTHVMEEFTETSDGHKHHFKIQTGPAIYMNNGHYHCYQGNTDMADEHMHGMNGCTAIA